MSIYKRASSSRGESSVEALASEIRDRYGPRPTPVLRLLEYARLRLFAEEIRAVSIDRDAGILAFRFDPGPPSIPASS